MQYEVKTLKKVGVNAYENDLNSLMKVKADDGWTVQQLLGNPDQGIVVPVSYTHLDVYKRQVQCGPDEPERRHLEYH